MSVAIAASTPHSTKSSLGSMLPSLASIRLPASLRQLTRQVAFLRSNARANDRACCGFPHRYSTLVLPIPTASTASPRGFSSPSERLPTLQGAAQQSKRHSTSTPSEADHQTSPWCDQQIQSHLAKVGAEVKKRSTGLGISGSSSPLDNFQVAFANQEERQKVRHWLEAHGLTESQLLDLCRVWEIQSWSACSSLLQKHGISHEWPPAILLHILEHVATFPEVAAAIDQIDVQLHTLDAKVAVVALSSLMKAACVRTSAVHLFGRLTDVIVRGAELILPHREERALYEPSLWEKEFLELLEDYVVNLTRWAEPRTRRAALRIISLADHLAQRRTVADNFPNRMRDLLCGITGREHLSTPVDSHTSYLRRERPSFQAYDWLFLEDGMWVVLAEGMDHRTEGEQLLFATMFATSAAQGNQSHLFEHLTALIQNLQGPLPSSSPIWQAAMIQYIQAILKFRRSSTDHAISLAQRVLQQALPDASGKLEMRLWKAFFRCGIARPDVDPELFLDLLSAGDEEGSHRRQPCTPSATCLKDSSLYDCLLSGLSRRRRISSRDIHTGYLIWQRMHNHGIIPSSKAAISMARICILGNYWLDALTMLEYLAVDSEADEAVSALRSDLQRLGIPMVSFSKRRRNAPPLPPLLPLPKGGRLGPRDASDSTWESRALLASIVSANQPLTCFSIWRYAPTILHSPFDSFSLANLLRAALQLSNMASASEDPDYEHVEWEGAAPVVQAKNFFQQILISQHPELSLENGALKAMRAGQNWIMRGEMEMQRWETRISDAWNSILRKSRPLNVIGTEKRKTFCVSKEQVALNSIVFDVRHFELYLVVCLHVRHIKGDDAQSHWHEPLQVLSWMRCLDIEPTTSLLCYVSQVICEAMPPLAVSRLDEEKSMGPLQDWCEEWIPLEKIPTLDQVYARNFVQFKTLRSSSWAFSGMQGQEDDDDDGAEFEERESS